MPGLVRKLVIIAAVDGLILLPSGNGSRNGGSNSNSSNNSGNSGGHGTAPLRIAYRTQKVTSLSAQAQAQANSTWERSASLEAHGLVGLLKVASHAFLISITQREQVAQILGKPIYAITNVAIIPLSSHADASHAIQQAQKNLARRDKEPSDDEERDDISSSDVEAAESDTGEEEGAVATPAVNALGYTEEEGLPLKSSVAQDVIGNRGRSGRFSLNNWFLRKRWLPTGPILSKPKESQAKDEESKAENTAEVRLPTEPAETEGTDVMNEAANESEARGEESTPPNRAIDLMPKLLRYTKLIFSSRNFFFSYDYDLTRRFSVQDPRNAQLPPHGRADSLYFWNKHLAQPLIDSGNDSDPFVLPLIQGFVGQREFTVASVKTQHECDAASPTEAVIEPGASDSTSPEPTDINEQEFLLTLISRRSTERPGLRYLRRGVDDEGNTANTVETEQLLSTPCWESSRNVYSLLQIRGSIPLYFSQSPYSLKPTPVLHHSNETNQLAFGRHFRRLHRKYGKIQIVSLLDKHGVEVKLGEAYEAYARAFSEEQNSSGPPLGFEWFDFHHECRGMKFENVRGVVDKLEDTLKEFGETIIQGNTVLKEQSGIVRTNCMDCLDRTGVTQCAFGQRALEDQLQMEGYTIDLRGDSSTQWFNVLWADNGDAISKQYSSTAALKGDYTRTRKRNYRGALNDFGLTLSRYYNNLVSDYFSQACVDYLLGNVSMQVFAEFQDHLQTIDPGISVSKLRQNAIDTCSRLVVDDQKEELLGGWAMMSPRQSNTLRTLPFEETILLLTDAAIYSCRLDWSVDKVLSFERVDLRSISRIRYGTYITSVLTDAQTDEQRNVGIVVQYRSGNANGLRVNTRTLQSSFPADAQENAEPREEWDLSSWLKGSQRTTTRFVAFKALPVSTSATSGNLSMGGAPVSEINAVRSVCQEIERALHSGNPPAAEAPSVVEESEIISLAEAKKRTGYLEQLVYDVKKLVWA